MGKGALMMVLAGIMAMSLAYVSKDESRYNSAIERADYEEKVLARETAQSAFNIIASKVINDFDNYRGSLTDKVITSGNYDISATEEVDGSVTVVAKGINGNHEYEITGSITLPTSTVLDALTVDAELDYTDMQNDYFITGINTNSDGSTPIGSNVHAILTTSQATATLVANDMASDQVVGVDGNMDVIVDSPELDLAALGTAIFAYSGSERIYYSGNYTKGDKLQNETFGSSANPVVLIVNGKLDLKNSTGYGILYVTDKLKLEGSTVWHGLVFNIQNGGKFEMKNSAAVYGAVVLRSTGNGSNSGYSGEDSEDAGLIGGHFDVDVFDIESDTKEVYHEHQYDDKYDVTFVDLLSSGCKHGGLCWDSLVDGYNNYRVEVSNEDYSGAGTYILQTGSTVYSGTTADGFTLDLVDAEDLSQFSFNFVDLCNLMPSNPGNVQDDAGDRQGALTIKVFGFNGGSFNANNPYKVYELVVYHHVKNGEEGLCSSNSEATEFEVTGKAMEFKMKNTSAIIYSASALSPLSALISELTFLSDVPQVVKISEVPTRVANSVLKY